MLGCTPLPWCGELTRPAGPFHSLKGQGSWGNLPPWWNTHTPLGPCPAGQPGPPKPQPPPWLPPFGAARAGRGWSAPHFPSLSRPATACPLSLCPPP